MDLVLEGEERVDGEGVGGGLVLVGGVGAIALELRARGRGVWCCGWKGRGSILIGKRRLHRFW